MNPHVQWRFDVARHLTTQLEALAGLEAVLVIGSVARGYSDAYSDLELMLVWEHPPSPAVRHAVMQAWQADFRYPASHPNHGHALQLPSVPVDVWHTTAAHEEAVIARVVRDYSLDLADSSRMETLSVGIALHGHDRVAPWKRAISAYPVELARRFLDTYLPHFHLRHLNLAAQRDNPTAYYHTLTDIQCSLFLVLLALNKTYFPTFRWLYPTLERLPIAPTQGAARLRQMFQEPPPAAARQLRNVLTETLALVEAHYPDLDTASVHDGLDQDAHAYARPLSAMPMPGIADV